jgi:hypothetical protein
MPPLRPLRHWGVAILLIAGGAIARPVARAQDFPPCPPPAAEEYLLLVRGETSQERDRIQNLLPASTSVMVCRYLDDTVVRAGGFTSLENANAWAQYLTEVEGAEAFVARPAIPGEETPVVAPAAPVEPIPSTPPTAAIENAAPPVVGYAPKLLGEGYAVLVDYASNPAIARQVQQSLNRPVGLAVYQQRPYLMAVQSPDPQVVATTLQTLSNGRFTAFIVDSSEVVLLSPAIATGN